VRVNEAGFWSAVGTHGGRGQLVGEWQIGHPHRTLSGADQQPRVRRQIRVGHQARPPHQHPDVRAVTCVGYREFRSNADEPV